MEDELTGMRMGLHDKKNVVATGVGFKEREGVLTDEVAIIVSVEKKVPLDELKTQDVIPQELSGLPTDVVEVGKIKALSLHQERMRPALGGISIGHEDVTAGTLGCLVEKNGKRYILSNNHVMANTGTCSVGDAILQPGRYDGGSVTRDKIALLTEFIPILIDGEDGTPSPSLCPLAEAVSKVLNACASAVGSHARLVPMSVSPISGATNDVDAALAEPLYAEDVVPQILGIGFPKGIGQGYLGCNVKKSGRTTGVTFDRIIQVGVTVDVEYGNGRVARFIDQLMAGPMSAGGDSGSLVLDEDDKAVGLLFAGSEQVTILNRIERVLEAFDATIVEE